MLLCKRRCEVARLLASHGPAANFNGSAQARVSLSAVRAKQRNAWRVVACLVSWSFACCHSRSFTASPVCLDPARPVSLHRRPKSACSSPLLRVSALPSVERPESAVRGCLPLPGLAVPHSPRQLPLHISRGAASQIFDRHTGRIFQRPREPAPSRTARATRTTLTEEWDARSRSSALRSRRLPRLSAAARQ